MADRFPDGHLYVDLRGFDPRGAVVRPTDAVRGFLEALGLAPQRIPADLDAQAALYRSLLAGREVLVLLDNARDVAQVRPLVPGTPGCVTVITSRTELAGLAATDGARLVHLDLLSDTDAHELLAHRLGPEQVGKEPEAAAEITSRCVGLPLALSIVGARATARPGFPLATLADELREAGDELTPFAGGDATSDVREVFSWSYRALGKDAATMFRRLGLHPGPDIAAPAAAAVAGFPVAQARTLLTELARSHLVTEHSPGRFAFHDLLRAYANELATDVETMPDRAAAVRRLLDHYLLTAHAAAVLVHPHRLEIEPVPADADVTPEPIADHAQALAWFTAEGPALLAAVSHAAEAGLHRHTWQLAWTVASFLDRRGRWDELLVAQQAAVEATRRLDDRPAHAHARRLLARTYAQLGRHDDAYVELRRSLDLSTAHGDRVGMATAHLGMEQILDRRDEPRPALDHARHALELFTGAGHRVGRAHALNAIGWLSTRLGDHEDALASCREALALHQELGNQHGEAATWDSLGYAHHHAGYHGEAVACFERALALSRDLDDRNYEADVLVHLGDTHAAAGDQTRARRSWRRAMTILDELGQPSAERVRAKLYALARDAMSG